MLPTVKRYISNAASANLRQSVAPPDDILSPTPSDNDTSTASDCNSLLPKRPSATSLIEESIIPPDPFKAKWSLQTFLQGSEPDNSTNHADLIQLTGGPDAVDRLYEDMAYLDMVDYDNEREPEPVFHLDQGMMQQIENCPADFDERLLQGGRLRSEVGILALELCPPANFIAEAEGWEVFLKGDEYAPSSSSLSAMEILEQTAVGGGVVEEEEEDEEEDENEKERLIGIATPTKHLMDLHKRVCRTRHHSVGPETVLERLRCMSWELGVLADEIREVLEEFEGPKEMSEGGE